MVAIKNSRLFNSIKDLAKIGSTPKGAITRITLTHEDKIARDWLVGRMKDLGLKVLIDGIGNIFGIRQGLTEQAPVMTGSHIDTVFDGGPLDGTYGILAGLEIIDALNEAGIKTKRPLCIVAFTNEEGLRFQPDMMGSLVFVGGLPLQEAYKVKDAEGVSLEKALDEIGYKGETPFEALQPYAFIELHIEQGPVLEENAKIIGVVEDLAGISWTEVKIKGVSNHAGTTPHLLRKDAGFAAAKLVVFLNDLAQTLGSGQRATVGTLNLSPNAINVVPGLAEITVDLRNPNNEILKKAEQKFFSFLRDLEAEGFEIETKTLARFDPVKFDPEIAKIIETHADSLGFSHIRMTSGAGHDAQMLARVCPSAMIFVPSIRGISHNGLEKTSDHHLLAGAETLLHTLLELSEK